LNYYSNEDIKLLLELVNWSQRCDRVKIIINEYNKKGKSIKDLQIIDSSDFKFPKRNHYAKWKNEYKWFNIGAKPSYTYCFLGVKINDIKK